MSESGWYRDADGRPTTAEEEDLYDEARGPGNPRPEGEAHQVGAADATSAEVDAPGLAATGGWRSAEEAAIHVVDDDEQSAQDARDDDAADPEEV